MSINPRRRFNIPIGESYCLWNLAERYTIDPNEFKSMGKATPFEGMEVYGRCYGTVYNGKTVYNR
jgi:dihydroorotase